MNQALSAGAGGGWQGEWLCRLQSVRRDTLWPPTVDVQSTGGHAHVSAAETMNLEQQYSRRWAARAPTGKTANSLELVGDNGTVARFQKR